MLSKLCLNQNPIVTTKTTARKYSPPTMITKCDFCVAVIFVRSINKLGTTNLIASILLQIPNAYKGDITTLFVHNLIQSGQLTKNHLCDTHAKSYVTPSLQNCFSILF